MNEEKDINCNNSLEKQENKSKKQAPLRNDGNPSR